MNRIHILSLALISILTFVSGPLLAQNRVSENETSSAEVLWSVNETVVETAETTLTRMEHGIYMTFDTVGLTPGDTYTAWWIIFNSPENCSDNYCNANDIFLVDLDGNPLLDSDGIERPNRSGRAAAQVSVLRASHGLVDEDGTLRLRAHLSIDDTTEVSWGPGLSCSVTSSPPQFISHRSHFVIMWFKKYYCGNEYGRAMDY